MTKDEAMALIARVQAEEPRIRATCDERKAQEDGHGYRVRLLLTVGQRTMPVRYADAWQSIRPAWGWLLDSKDEQR